MISDDDSFFGVWGNAFVLLPTPSDHEHSLSCKLAFMLGLAKQSDRDWGYAFFRLMDHANFVMDERFKGKDLRGLRVWHHIDLNESFSPRPGQGSMREMTVEEREMVQRGTAAANDEDGASEEEEEGEDFKPAAEEEGGDDEEEPETWELKKVFTARQIKRSDAPKCESDECDGRPNRRACSKWVSNRNEPWFSCLDCQER